MSYPVYYVEESDTLPVLFTTYDGGTGASITLTGLAVTDIEIYKDGSITQRSSDAGYSLIDTDGIDIDTTTGLHGFTIDLSDNTDAGFYAVGSWYHVVVNAVTVDAQTVVFIACAFRIVSATRGMAGTALPAAAADAAGGLVISDAGGLDVDGLNTNVSAILSDTGTDGVLLAATATSAQLVDDVWDEVLTAATHNVASSAGRRLRTASGGQLDSGTAQAGSSDTLTLATSASTTVGLYVGCALVIDGGTGAGQARYIVGYTAGRVATVARPWTTTPDATSTYVLYADNQIDFLQMGLAAAGGATSITLDANASATDDIYNGQAIRIFGGTGKYQVRVISDYNGTTKVATVERAWTTNPDATSYYAVLGLDTKALDIDILADTGTDGVVVASVGSGAIDSSSFAAGAIDTAAVAAGVVGGIDKNATFSNFMFVMRDSTNHDPATSLTVTATVSIDAGAFGAAAGSVTEVANGVYQFDALAADTNGTVITWRFSATGADDTFFTFRTIP